MTASTPAVFRHRTIVCGVISRYPSPARLSRHCRVCTGAIPHCSGSPRRARSFPGRVLESSVGLGAERTDSSRSRPLHPRELQRLPSTSCIPNTRARIFLTGADRFAVMDDAESKAPGKTSFVAGWQIPAPRWAALLSHGNRGTGRRDTGNKFTRAIQGIDYPYSAFLQVGKSSVRSSESQLHHPAAGSDQARH